MHDETSVWHRIEFDMDGGHNGGHVHLLLETEGDCLAFEDIGVRIWGRAMREHAPENVPLDGVSESSAPPAMRTWAMSSTTGAANRPPLLHELRLA